MAAARILDLTLAKVDGNHRVTHMIAEIVKITDPVLDENSSDSALKEAFDFIQNNAKQVLRSNRWQTVLIWFNRKP